MGSVDQTVLLLSHSDLFAITDSNGDGKLTFSEWRDSTVRSSSPNEDDMLLYQHWRKFDTANLGFLIEDEAVNRRT
jgi:hypothetical protein